MSWKATTKKKGRLFWRAHGDCFLHATGSWLSYWPISLSNKGLLIVRVTLPDEHSFLTTLCPTALNYSTVWKGASRDRYLEIDTAFAKELGISKPDIEVAVEAVSEIEHCSELVLEPVSPEDLEKLENNQGKIEFELLNKIRVVSGQHFTFPIWIGATVIPVRVVSSDPAATWVLLSSEDSGKRGERATVIRFKPARSPSSTSSSIGSIETPINSSVPHSNSVVPCPFPRNPDLPSTPVEKSDSTGGGSSGATSPNSDDTSSLASSASSILWDLLRRIGPKQIPSQAAVAGLKSGSKTPEPSISAPPTFSYSTSDSAHQSKHKKTKSWSHSSEMESKPVLPPYIETPNVNAILRVQPHPIRGIVWPEQNLEGGKIFWESTRVFDAFVHPSTFPEFSNHYLSTGHLGSFLVQVTHVGPPPVLKGSSKQQQKPDRGEELGSEDFDRPDSQELGRSESVPASDTALELSQIMSAVAGLVGQDKREGLVSPPSLSLPHSLVLRLCFATKLVCCDKKMTPYILPPQDDSQEQQAGEEVHLVPGHILMSDVVQRQLLTGSCGLVRVSQVREEARLPAAHCSVTIRLHALDIKHVLLPEHRQKLLTNVKLWVQQVHENNPFGVVLINSQVIPIIDHKGDACHCIAAMTADNPKATAARQTLPYCLVTPHELSLSRGAPRVKITVEKSQERPRVREPEFLPLLSELDPPEITLKAEHLGAFDTLLREGSHFLKSALLDCQRGKPKGRLLITGTTGDVGLACGKTSLAKLLAKSVTGYPVFARLEIVECASMRGQTAVRVGRRLKEIFQNALLCQPSVVILDDLHHSMPNFKDVEEQATGEGFLSVKKAQALLDELSVIDQKNAAVAIIATIRCKEDLHPLLLQSRGNHVFEKVLEIQPPNLADRQSILKAAMRCRGIQSLLGDNDLRTLALKMEGFQAGDLANIVDRAINSAQLTLSCPADNISDSDQLLTPTRRTRTSSSSDNISPLLSRSWPSSPLKKHKLLKYTVSCSPPKSRQKQIYQLAAVSTATLVPTEGGLRLTISDFSTALKGFVPMTLRGLAMSSAGAIDFSDVGGMYKTKKVLRETILWPSKYPRLFSQCPIRMCRGILLYGAPGTGKTLLAGSVAKEFRLNFVSVKGPEILSKYIGASEQAVRDLFARAQAAKPCILFFDEFDSLAPKRGHDRTGVTDRVVNQLLTQLDGVEALEGVYVLAATSRPDLIDPALLRPGRIDKSIFCDHPNEEERLDILKALSKGLHLGKADLRKIAQQTEYYTGADLKAILYSAQLRAVHEILGDKGTYSEASDTSGQVSSQETRTESQGKVMVFDFSSGCTQRQAKSDLEKRANTLHQIMKKKTGETTLQQSGHGVGEKTTVCITRHDLLAALGDVKPSVTAKERQKFNEIYSRFSGKIKLALENVLEQRATMA